MLWGELLADKRGYDALMFGSHLSISGGLHNALLSARQLDMDCVQVFTKNQRQWSCKPLSSEEVRLWRQHRRGTKIEQVVSHDSYLINLASPSDEAWEKSIAAFREELIRAEALEIQNLVTHPGAHLNSGEDAGMERVARALDRLHRELPGYKVTTCLEITAGQGSSLGYRFEQLRRIIDLAAEPERLAVCLDTAHMLAAGYDLTSAAGARGVIEELDDVVGLKLVRAIHVNDSKTPQGSRVDRHEHIGHGHIPLEAFRVFTTHRAFAKVPKILETPKETHPEGKPWDAVNLQVLRGLRKS